MIKFRRAIAIFILALFTCQSIMAGVDEHVEHSSNTEVVHGLHLNNADHDPGASTDHGQPFTPDLIDGDCCHAHGHCHLLAFTGQLACVSILLSQCHAASIGDAYNSLSPNTLLRPPTRA
jgi:hypothetical protein